MERIQAYARGETWEEEEDVDNDTAAAADYDQDRDADSDYEEENKQAAPSGRSRKRGRAAAAKTGKGPEQAPAKRRRARAKQQQQWEEEEEEEDHDDAEALQAQRLPMIAFLNIGAYVSSYDKKLAFASTCHLARETLFDSRSMEENWIKAYARKRKDERVIQTEGSRLFALTGSRMQASCHFESKYVRHGRYKHLFMMTDLFRLAIRTHQGWKGFIAALQRRKRRSDAQHRAIEMRGVKSRVQFLRDDATFFHTELGLASAAPLVQELDGVMAAAKKRGGKDARQLQAEVNECYARYTQLKTASTVLTLGNIQRHHLAMLQRFPAEAEKLRVYTERLQQVQAVCRAAPTVEALPSQEDMARLLSQRDSLEQTAHDAMRAQSPVDSVKGDLRMLPAQLGAVTASVSQELDDAVEAYRQGQASDVRHLQAAVNECRRKTGHLQAASRLLSQGDIGQESMRVLREYSASHVQLDSYAQRLEQLKAQCGHASTVEALPSQEEMTRLWTDKEALQQEAHSARRTQSAINRIKSDLRSMPEQLARAAASVSQELDGVLARIQQRRFGDEQQLQTAVRECRANVDRLRSASQLLTPEAIPQGYERVSVWCGLGRELDSFVERLQQVQAQCGNAATVEALPSNEAIAQLLSESVRLAQLVESAMRAQSAISAMASDLRSMPEELEAVTASLTQELDGIQQRQFADLSQLQSAVGRTRRKHDHLSNAARLLSSEALPPEPLREPEPGVESETKSYTERLEQLRQQCRHASTVEALPSQEDMARLLAEKRALERRPGTGEHTQATASLMETGDIPPELMQTPDGYGVRNEKLNAYMEKLRQMRQRCRNATTKAAMPSQREVSTLLQYGRALLRNARDKALKYANRRRR